MATAADVQRVTKSYSIPISDLTLAERQNVRAAVDANLLTAALKTAIRDDPSQLIIRDALPNLDLGLAATDDWLIAGVGVAGTELQYISQLIAQTQAIGVYGVSIEQANPAISRIRLSLGPASNTTLAQYQIEDTYPRLEPVAYFSEPTVFPKNVTARIMVMPRTAFAANTQRLQLLARTIEPLGDVISTPSV